LKKTSPKKASKKIQITPVDTFSVEISPEDGIKVPVDIKLEDNRCIPQYQTAGSACADIVARIPPQIIDGINIGSTVKLGYRCLAVISCGFSVAIPPGYKLCIAARSGLATRGLVVMNAPAQIDSDFRGVVQAIVANVTGRDIITINDGDRFAQCWLEPVYKMDWNLVTELSSTVRGVNGLGSTGV